MSSIVSTSEISFENKLSEPLSKEAQEVLDKIPKRVQNVLDKSGIMGNWRERIAKHPHRYKDVDLPFPFVHVTEEDERLGRVSKGYPCMKFQTPHYIAYVPFIDYLYITAENLYRENESLAMMEARRYMWGELSGKEGYQILRKYPNEVNRVDMECQEISARQINDNREVYGDDFVDRFNAIGKKYTPENFVSSTSTAWTIAHWGKIKAISAIAAASFTGLTFFFTRFQR